MLCWEAWRGGSGMDIVKELMLQRDKDAERDTVPAGLNLELMGYFWGCSVAEG